MNKNLIKEFIREAVVAASAEYARKEDVREALQAVLQQFVSSGTISSQEELDSWWKSVDMSVLALRHVPLDVWKRMSK